MSRFLLPYSRHEHRAPLADAPAVEAIDVSISYPGSAMLALERVSVKVPVGARFALVGANGSGKSTLLKAIAGLLPLRSGEILIYGHARGGCHHRVSYLPQRSEVDWRFPMSVRRLVLTGRYVHLGWFKRPRAADRQLADQMLSRLGIAALADRQIGQLSGGQQQRALLARALVQDADLLLLDEPLNAVDAETRAVMESVLADLKQRGKTVLVATHDIDRLEADFDGVVFLNEGREIAPERAQHIVPGEGAWAG